MLSPARGAARVRVVFRGPPQKGPRPSFPKPPIPLLSLLPLLQKYLFSNSPLLNTRWALTPSPRGDSLNLLLLANLLCLLTLFREREPCYRLYNSRGLENIVFYLLRHAQGVLVPSSPRPLHTFFSPQRNLLIHQSIGQHTLSYKRTA